MDQTRTLIGQVSLRRRPWLVAALTRQPRFTIRLSHRTSYWEGSGRTRQEAWDSVRAIAHVLDGLTLEQHHPWSGRKMPTLVASRRPFDEDS